MGLASLDAVHRSCPTILLPDTDDLSLFLPHLPMQSHPTYRDSSRPLHLLLESLNIVSSVSESHPAVELWNVDVMHIIMSYADRRVISSLMKTCNALNSAGMKYLLAIEDEVCLRRKEGLVSFIRFLQARGNPSECSRRLKFLTKLNLEFNHPTEHVARILECLFEFLAHVSASNFTSLKIWDVEALLASHPPLGVAIANLSILKTLDFLYAGEHCAVLLRTLQSNLTTVKIHFGHYCREQEGEILAEPDVNPIMLLEGSQSTLQYLSASFSLSSPDGPRYANMTHLELSCTDFPHIEHYIRAFPNLQSLTSFECTGYGDEDWHERREMSMLYQTQHGTWQSLRRFQGSLLILWVLGLTCRIPSVRLTFEQQIGVNPNFLNDIILDVRPSELALRLLGASSLLDDAVRAVLSEEGRLQGLELCLLFHVNESDGTVSVGHILVSLGFRYTFKVAVSLTSLYRRT